MDLQRTEDNHREHEVETWTSRGQRTITGSMKWRHGPPEDRGHIQGTSSEDMDLQKTEDTHRELLLCSRDLLVCIEPGCQVTVCQDR